MDSSKARKRAFPRWVEPMKATLTDERFSDPDWIYELKLDGERCLAFIRKGEVTLWSRNQKRIDGSYPEIADDLAGLVPVDAILDGEIVALVGGMPRFSALQRRMHVRAPSPALIKSHPVQYHVFDMVYVDGYDVAGVPLLERKALLREVVPRHRRVKVVRHKKQKGEQFFEETCAKPGAEGVIAKRASSPYTGKRSKDWLKFKCAYEQEFVVGGWTDPQGSRTGLGALLVGYYEADGRLHYAGKVGTGFDRAMLELLVKELTPLATDKSPFVAGAVPKDAHWVKPKLVVQVGFGEWAGDALLRHPRFLGIRRDKKARDVVREG